VKPSSPLRRNRFRRCREIPFTQKEEEKERKKQTRVRAREHSASPVGGSMAVAPTPMASWQLPPPERIPPEELQSILAGLRWQRNTEHEAADRRAEQDGDAATDHGHPTVAPEEVATSP
jgi:hypothetical protein